MQLAPVVVVVSAGPGFGTAALPLLSQFLLHGRHAALLPTCAERQPSLRPMHNTSGVLPAPHHTGTHPQHRSPHLPAHRASSLLPPLLSSLFPSPAPAALLPILPAATSPFISLLSLRHASASASSSSGTGSGAAGSGSGSGSSSGSSGSGPHELLASKCRVLRFSLSRGEADAEWRRHHQGVFTSQPVAAAAVKASLMPYWCISAEAHIAVHSAQIGRDYLANRYNPTTRRYEPRWETEWHSVAPHWAYSRRLSAESGESQVYGGSKYRADPALRAMKPGEYVRQALTYGEYVRRTAGEQQQQQQPERMVPFRLAPEEAVEAARQAIRQAELRNAEAQLLQTYGGDRVRLVVMDVQLAAGLSATPVFVPVYVFKSRIRGTAMRTYIAGFRSGLSSGPLLPNPTRVAAAATAATSMGLMASGALAGASLPAALGLGVALPYLIGYGVASLWPELHANFLRLRAALQRPLPDPAAEEQERWWRYEWVRQDVDDSTGYGYSDDGRYGGSYSRRGAGGAGGFDGFGGQGAAGGAASGGGGRATRGSAGSDPRGYYRTLGVSPGSSTEDIQAAFRAAALKWHPDRQPDPTRKVDSTRKFQAAQEAYSVLRDPHRRAAYDRGA
ncbi:hypothetical protein PLESTB_000719000 [Pleodorina starrii]|uniref:J domain-containing protein n=1 Tax=Pleodorina starrii TaxID=330485 RepID=A0A9W6BK25_9CHLO|nr:hypothetical protein PLESTM_001708500 [Pleodorina starrii]GLC53200.1 hypothetical protein PLESTB_000719000 [Pleodorina starrii]GLC68655.1 hypothetical protein PLESTF_000719600 [Pleodorina starrii]